MLTWNCFKSDEFLHVLLIEKHSRIVILSAIHQFLGWVVLINMSLDVVSSVEGSTGVVIFLVVTFVVVSFACCVVEVDKDCDEVVWDVVEELSACVLICGFSDVVGSTVVLIDFVVASVVGSNVVLFIWIVVVDTGSIVVVFEGTVTIVVVEGDSVVVITQSTI